MYVKFVCVIIVVVCVREAAGEGAGGEGTRDTESKTRTPHKDVGNDKSPIDPLSIPWTFHEIPPFFAVESCEFQASSRMLLRSATSAARRTWMMSSFVEDAGRGGAGV
jgi:hypothetical protein